MTEFEDETFNEKQIFIAFDKKHHIAKKLKI